MGGREEGREGGREEGKEVGLERGGREERREGGREGGKEGWERVACLVMKLNFKSTELRTEICPSPTAFNTRLTFR